MFSKSIYLDKNTDEKLTIAWEVGFSFARIFFNDREIGTFQNKNELIAGKSFQLYGDDVLFIQFSFKYTNFIIKRNNVYVSNSPYHPSQELRSFRIISGISGGLYALWSVPVTISYMIEGIPFLWLWPVHLFTLYCIASILLPFLAKKGMPFVFHAYVLATLALLVFMNFTLFNLGGFNWYDEWIFVAIINIPLIASLIATLRKNKAYREVANDREKRMQHQNIIQT